MAHDVERYYQNRVKAWIYNCFGRKITHDRTERNQRLLEECLELVQATGMSKKQALDVLAYVYARPPGEIKQEVGGVMVCLAAFCIAHDISMHDAGWQELIRIDDPEVIAKIRAKQSAKPNEVVGMRYGTQTSID